MIGYTYAQLLAGLQDWPVNKGANYISNIPRLVELGELRLVRDLNMEIFDVIDSSQTITVGTRIASKPAELIVLRTMRLALITGTSSQAAVPTNLCLTQATAGAQAAPLTQNGLLGAAPQTVPIPAQATVTEIGDPQGGILVTVTGYDNNGVLRSEQIVSIQSGTAAGNIRWSRVTGITSQNGSSAQTIEVGTAAVAQSTLGYSWPVYKRSFDFVNNFAADPAVTGRPRYYAELDLNTWQLAQACDQSYQLVVRFLQRPTSIAIAGTSWLGDRCGDVLFLACLMEAEHYIKADDRFADMQEDYGTKLQVCRTELRNQIRVGDYEPTKPTASASA